MTFPVTRENSTDLRSKIAAANFPNFRLRSWQLPSFHSRGTSSPLRSLWFALFCPQQTPPHPRKGKENVQCLILDVPFWRHLTAARR